jgi:hypothetical protein
MIPYFEIKRVVETLGGVRDSDLSSLSFPAGSDDGSLTYDEWTENQVRAFANFNPNRGHRLRVDIGPESESFAITSRRKRAFNDPYNSHWDVRFWPLQQGSTIVLKFSSNDIGNAEYELGKAHDVRYHDKNTLTFIPIERVYLTSEEGGGWISEYKCSTLFDQGNWLSDSRQVQKSDGKGDIPLKLKRVISDQEKGMMIEIYLDLQKREL